MGSSCSSTDRNDNYLPFKSPKSSASSSPNLLRLNSHKYTPHKLKRLKPKLLKVLSPNNSQNIPQWPTYYKAFENYINSIDNSSISQWLSNIEEAAISSLDYLSQTSPKEIPLRIPASTPKANPIASFKNIFRSNTGIKTPKGADSPISDSPNSCNSSPISNQSKNTDGLQMLKIGDRIVSAPELLVRTPRKREGHFGNNIYKETRRHKRMMTCLEFSENTDNINNLVTDIEIKRLSANNTAKMELKHSILSHIGTEDHIMQGLVREFMNVVQENYQQFLDINYLKEQSMEDIEHLLEEIRETIVHFVDCMREFLQEMYRDLVKQLKYALRDEDEKPEYVIEEAVYDVLLKENDSVVQRLIYSLLKIKYQNSTDKLKEQLINQKDNPLQSYDKNLANSKLFLMKNDSQPYKKVCEKILLIKTKGSPYDKLHLASKLEEEMLACLREYHNNDFDKMTKIRSSFGLDVKLPILMYCLVQTGDEQLFLEKKFIKMFVNRRHRRKNQAYQTFKGCIKFLLNASEGQ